MRNFNVIDEIEKKKLCICAIYEALCIQFHSDMFQFSFLLLTRFFLFIWQF